MKPAFTPWDEAGQKAHPSAARRQVGALIVHMAVTGLASRAMWSGTAIATFAFSPPGGSVPAARLFWLVFWVGGNLP